MVVDEGICVAACPLGKANFLREVYIYQNQNSIIYRRENYCDIPPIEYQVDNCSLYDTSVRSHSNLYEGDVVVGCVKCLDGFLPVIQLDDEKIIGQATNWNQNPDNRGFGNRFSFISYCYD